jgi:hypothetical protein
MQGGLGARKERLKKEAELARREQELTRREAAVNAKRDLSKALGGASVTSKKARGAPKNKCYDCAWLSLTALSTVTCNLWL